MKKLTNQQNGSWSAEPLTYLLSCISKFIDWLLAEWLCTSLDVAPCTAGRSRSPHRASGGRIQVLPCRRHGLMAAYRSTNAPNWKEPRVKWLSVIARHAGPPAANASCSARH